MATENAVTVFAMEFSAYGQARVSNEPRKNGSFVSPSGARSIWLWQGLESMKYSLIAFEKKAAEEGNPDTYQPGHSILRQRGKPSDLDAWLKRNNKVRTRQGKTRCGRKPMQTLLDGKSLWEEKVGHLN